METNKKQTGLRTVAKLALEAFDHLSREGKGLGVEELAESLGASEELTAMLTPLSDTDKFHKNEILRLKKELSALKSQFEKADAQRRDLASQLDTVEGRNTRGQAFVQRVLPTLAQLIQSGGNTQLDALLDHIRKLAKNNAPLDHLENAFQQLKEIAFRAELKKEDKKPSVPKTGTLFNLFKHPNPSGQPDTIAYFKETYLGIVEELRLNLDQASMSALSDIKAQVGGALKIDDFSYIRKELLQLLRLYISRINTDREQAAAFILEIGERLLEVERHMLRSLASARESRSASDQFTSTIDKEMDAFQESVNTTQSLEELKSRVVARISAIKEVIESSRGDALHRSIQVDKEISVLQMNLDRMNNEIKSAREHSETLEAKLLTDPLTQAFNRRAYDQRIDHELKRFHRYQSVFSMLLMDVDHFKLINDKYGHSVGDLCLKEIINRTRPLLRETDFLARFGGEEFIILLPETVTIGAEKAAEKIRMQIEKTEFLHKGETVRVTISLGGAEVMASDKTGEDMFERVDKALYQAKQSGRNKVVMG